MGRYLWRLKGTEHTVYVYRKISEHDIPPTEEETDLTGEWERVIKTGGFVRAGSFVSKKGAWHE